MGFWVDVGPGRSRYFQDESAYVRLTGRKVEVHNVIDDTMPATWHPVTGETFESKSRFRETTRVNGCVELDGADLNPGQRDIPEPKTEEIGKQIHDIMEARHVDEKVIKREIAEFLRSRG